MMRKKLYIFLVVLISITIVISIVLVVNKQKYSMGSEIELSIERMNHSIKSDTGAIVVAIYYDKPVMTGSSDAAQKINAYFEQEYQQWLHESNKLTSFLDNRMDHFLAFAQEMRESEFFGDKSLEIQPLCYTVDAEVIMLDQNILSIKQTVYWFAGGPSGESYFGSTFDLHTGERIPFDDIVDVNAYEFRDKLLSWLLDLYSDCDDPSVKKEFESGIKYYYWPNDLYNYDIYINKHVYQLNYEYYYDGEYFYIPENNHLYRSGTSEIIKWNGKTGDEFEISLVVKN